MVRQRFAKPLYAGSNPVLTSKKPSSALGFRVSGVKAACRLGELVLVVTGSALG